MRRAFRGLFFILLTSCATTMGNVALCAYAQRDYSINHIIARYGQPLEVIKNHDGTITYIFRTEEYRQGPGPMSPQVGVSGGRGRPVVTVTNVPVDKTELVLTCTRIYLVNRAGKILKMRQAGNGC